jgi:methylamine---glutamate N-methyltransferase subunit B
MNAAANPAIHRLSLDQLTERDLHQRLAAIAEANGSAESKEAKNSVLIEIYDVHRQDFSLMAIQAPVRLHVQGPLGHYAFSYNLGADARIDGDVGNGVGEGLRGGSVRVRGNAGLGFGVGMRGGTLAVYGAAGDRMAGAMVGGEVFARGDVGDDVGVGARGGTIVIGGDAGWNLGEPQGDLIIFIRGKVKSLAPGMVEVPLRKRDELRLGLLLINASIRGDAKDFRRIVCEAALEAERSRRKGEVDPNWR